MEIYTTKTNGNENNFLEILLSLVKYSSIYMCWTFSTKHNCPEQLTYIGKLFFMKNLKSRQHWNFPKDANWSLVFICLIPSQRAYLLKTTFTAKNDIKHDSRRTRHKNRGGTRVSYVAYAGWRSQAGHPRRTPWKVNKHVQKASEGVIYQCNSKLIKSLLSVCIKSCTCII